MALLIYGYNLLHVSGIFGAGRGPGGLHRSREALLRFLAAAIDDSERLRTTIVFDAAEAPPGLPRTVTHEQITVHFAANYEDADAMIEELIAQADAPRSLLVVSSDHRIQRAARRRRAKYADSDVWYAQAVRRRTERTRPTRSAKPTGPLSEDEVARWLKEFDIDANDFDSMLDAAAESAIDADEPTKPGSPKRDVDSHDVVDDLRNPFPPGYADDLLDP
jgi:predicted RNA-binding protein with PIN domain